ncbi:alpha-1-antichymotrypsin-like [Sorex fumeus]|uniref:alpha-1-antichymotrypsin-like n=1 Tax=Sorex fumeus TaxID=62283 RepID=UPI0024AE30B0|nr:alpha-1-antichymotrypsin-like [Sorex fumeus]
MDIFTLANRSNEFSLRLYKLLAAQSPESNIIISPISISMALAFLALGAGGDTKTEILQSLKFNLTKTPEAKIHQSFQLVGRLLRMTNTNLKQDLSTALFVDQQLVLKKDFQQKAQQLYSANTTSVNFQDITATKKLINNFVEQKTHGKIKDVVKYLDTHTRMVLVNSLFFNAKWKMPFDPNYNFNSTFYLSTKKWVNVTAMRAEKKKILYFWDNRYSLNIVLLPYKDGRISMFLILPNNGAMPKLEAELNMDLIYFWKNSMRLRLMSLYVPKLSVSRGYNLEQVLPMLGTIEFFSQVANFSGLSTARNQGLIQVVHKAVLDVAEKGTEEAPSQRKSKVPPPRLLRQTLDFSRPFMVIVFSEITNNILLLGKVVNPKQA